MKKRFILFSAGTLVLMPAVSQAEDPAPRPVPKRSGAPNIVFIVADDLGFGDVGFNGSVIPTPNIDHIASSGIELTRFYTAAISSPTRCGLMTGRYPDRFRVRSNVIRPWNPGGLDPQEEILPQLLERHGYEDRALIGKWHMGHAQEALHPLNRGFTHFYGFLNGLVDYFTHEREGQLDWHRGWESCHDRGYTTDLIAEEAVRCIGEYARKDSPYFVYVAFNAPHTPYEAPEDELEKFISADSLAALPRRDRDGWTYRAMVSRLDKGIGRVLEAVNATGEASNTLILFMSDNGGVPGLEPYCNNGIHRGAKGSEWEGGVHNAAAIWWPDGFRNGRPCDQLMAFIDIVPTIADIIGAGEAPERPYDGVSMYSVLRGRRKPFGRDLYLGRGAAVSGSYKLVKAGVSDSMMLEEDFFTDLEDNPSEKPALKLENSGVQYERLRKLADWGDAIVPAIPEYRKPKSESGFVAPFEWHYHYMDRQ